MTGPLRTTQQLANEFSAFLRTKPSAQAITSELLRQPPPVQEQFLRLMGGHVNVETGGRDAPFDARWTDADLKKHIGRDHREAKAVFQTMQDNELAAGLLDRMGSDEANLPVEPPTTRDAVAAAFTAVTGE